MKDRIRFAFVAASLLPLCLAAQTPFLSSRPPNATGQCKDATYTTASAKSGACRGHNGLREWFTTSPAAIAPQALPAANPVPPPASPSATNVPQAAPQGKGPKARLATTPAAPGGAPNLVWLNASSSVYHCYGTDFYGKTKSGAYMTEADAKAKGAHGNRGATCTK